MDPHLDPLWGAASSHQLPPRVSSGSSSPDETVQGVKSGGDKGNKDKHQGKKDKSKKEKKDNKEKKGKKKKDDDDDAIPDQENAPLTDGSDDDDNEDDFGLDGLTEILEEHGKKGSKATPATKKPATHTTKKRPASASKKKCEEAFQITSMYPALMFVFGLKRSTFFYTHMVHIPKRNFTIRRSCHSSIWSRTWRRRLSILKALNVLQGSSLAQTVLWR